MAIKKILSEKKSQVEVYTKLLKKLIEDQKNQWIPCPIGNFTEESEKVEVNNKDIAQYNLSIYFGDNTYGKKEYYLYVIFSKYI